MVCNVVMVLILQADKHHSLLIEALCKELGCTGKELMDIELCLADTQPAVSDF